MILNRKKIILDKKTQFNNLTIENVELREYEVTEKGKKKSNVKTYIITIYVKTNNGELEMEYIEKSTDNLEEFEEYYSFLCNYNGLYSAINRIIIELDKKKDKKL